MAREDRDSGQPSALLSSTEHAARGRSPDLSTALHQPSSAVAQEGFCCQRTPTPLPPRCTGRVWFRVGFEARHREKCKAGSRERDVPRPLVEGAGAEEYLTFLTSILVSFGHKDVLMLKL